MSRLAVVTKGMCIMHTSWRALASTWQLHLTTIKCHHTDKLDIAPFIPRKLPKAVSRLAQAHNPKFGGQAYIHCTAGLGRAPAVALAYMHWLRGWDLDEAHASLTSVRRCSPRIEAIRAATADLLTGCEPLPATVSLPSRSIHKTLQVSVDRSWAQARTVCLVWSSCNAHYLTCTAQALLVRSSHHCPLLSTTAPPYSS